MSRLAKTVFVADPDRPGVTVRLNAGQEVPEHLEAAVTNPDAWEDGKLPTTPEERSESEHQPDQGDSSDAKPVAKKAAARPARGRKSAADEGSS